MNSLRARHTIILLTIIPLLHFFSLLNERQRRGPGFGFATAWQCQLIESLTVTLLSKLSKYFGFLALTQHCQNIYYHRQILDKSFLSIFRHLSHSIAESPILTNLNTSLGSRDLS
jgi:hypothetical protein